MRGMLNTGWRVHEGHKGAPGSTHQGVGVGVAVGAGEGAALAVGAGAKG